MPDEILRRNRVDLMCEAERLILLASWAIEKMPADVRLTEAQTLLSEARSKVADFVDGHPAA